MGIEPKTIRLSSGVIRTEISGRILAETIKAMAAQYRKVAAPGSMWLIDASGASSYAYDAIETAKESFGVLREHYGLRVIVAIIVAPLVRMGAMTVSAGMRAAGSPIVIRVVSDDLTAQRALSMPLDID